MASEIPQPAVATRADLEEQIRAYDDLIVSELAPYNRLTAIVWWIDILRAVEELINLPEVDWKDEAFEHLLFEQPLSHFLAKPQTLALVRDRLRLRLNEKLANRLYNLITFSAYAGVVFRELQMFGVAIGFQNIASLIGYFQSRRRHFVGLLHLMASACIGRLQVPQIEGLGTFLPIVEGDGLPMMRIQNSLIEMVCCERLNIANVQPIELKMLDGLYLEPERARVTDMPWANAAKTILEQREPQPTDRLFSAAELRNDLIVLRAAYLEFDLDGTDFSHCVRLIDHLSRHFIDRDFWIKIEPQVLEHLFDSLKTPPGLRSAVVNKSKTYMGCLSTYAPFVRLDGEYLSTVTLLSRFAYYWRGRVLNRNKRFQIRAGYIFEDAAAAELTALGFDVQNITRVEGREFDVVTLRDGVIWNFQCKNNFVDLDRVEADANRFARYNRLFVKSYEKALAKEEAREELLIKRLGVTEIRHIVISKFPVITDNPRIVPFNRLNVLRRDNW